MAFDLQATDRQEIGPAGAQDHGIAPLAGAAVR